MKKKENLLVMGMQLLPITGNGTKHMECAYHYYYNIDLNQQLKNIRIIIQKKVQKFQKIIDKNKSPYELLSRIEVYREVDRMGSVCYQIRSKISNMASITYFFVFNDYQSFTNHYQYIT